jgi:cytochrome c peroxidase
MAPLQLGVAASDEEVRDIIAFLGSLTGTLPENFTMAPVLPAEH